MRQIYRKTGTEGSRHDPYEWEEITVVAGGPNGRRTTLRRGALGYERLLVNGVKVIEVFGEASLETVFREYSGVSLEEAERVCYMRSNSSIPEMGDTNP
jgi:hypothetical protein